MLRRCAGLQLSALEVAEHDEFRLCAIRGAIPWLCCLHVLSIPLLTMLVSELSELRVGVVTPLHDLVVELLYPAYTGNLIGNSITFPPDELFVLESSVFGSIVTGAVQGYFSSLPSDGPLPICVPGLASESRECAQVPASQGVKDPYLQATRRLVPWADPGNVPTPDMPYWGDVVTQRWTFATLRDFNTWQAAWIDGSASPPASPANPPSVPRVTVFADSLLDASLVLPVRLLQPGRAAKGLAPCLDTDVVFRFQPIPQGPLITTLDFNYSMCEGLAGRDVDGAEASSNAAILSALLLSVALLGVVLSLHRFWFACASATRAIESASRARARDGSISLPSRTALVCAVCSLWDVYMFAALVVCSALAAISLASLPAPDVALMDDQADRLGVCLAAAFVWVSLLRVTRFRPTWATAQRTVARSFPAIAQFFLAAVPLFLACAVYAVSTMGSFATRFSDIPSASVALFAFLNGDVMRETFLMGGYHNMDLGGRLISILFLALFIILFIYFVLNACTALVEEAFVLQRPLWSVPVLPGRTIGQNTAAESQPVDMANPGDERVSDTALRRALVRIAARDVDSLYQSTSSGAPR